METPSTFHLNFSPIMIGERTAVDIIETHIVDDVNITFPKDNDTALKASDKIIKNNPKSHSNCI